MKFFCIDGYVAATGAKNEPHKKEKTLDMEVLCNTGGGKKPNKKKRKLAVMLEKMPTKRNICEILLIHQHGQ